MKYDLIIFDCDGTIVNSELFLNKIFSEIIVEMGYAKYTPEYCVEHFKGWGYPYIAATIVHDYPEFPLTKFEQKLIETSKKRLATELEAMPNAEFLLKELKDYDKCVASNGDAIIVRNSLKVTGLYNFFKDEHIFTYELVKAGKPSPDLFLHAAKQFNVDPKKCLVIEDSLPGVTGAINAGMNVLVYRPHNVNTKADNQIDELKIRAVVKDLKEVLNYINSN